MLRRSSTRPALVMRVDVVYPLVGDGAEQWDPGAVLKRTARVPIVPM
jgi:hypothetical protein